MTTRAKSKYYVAIGSVRGWCGHRHQAQATAERCADQDGRDVKRGHGVSAYSDMQVNEIESGYHPNGIVNGQLSVSLDR